MAAVINASAFESLIVKQVPLLDLRAPIEYNKGALACSVNQPILFDDERAAVGTCYKKKGQQAAIALGHELVKGDVKEKRLHGWLDFVTKHAQAYLLCFRGGLRSCIAQRWLEEAGVNVAYINGGYKAIRTFLLTAIEQLVAELPLVLISGQTGCGKTALLNTLTGAIDLEALANHRGSSFGRLLTPQPTQSTFENNLATQLLRHRARQHPLLILEDESRLIGQCLLPYSLRQKMQQAPVIWLQTSREEREARLLNAYVRDMFAGYSSCYGEAKGFIVFSDYLRQSIHRIKNRFGQKNHDDLIRLVNQALKIQTATGEIHCHLMWIKEILNRYYDPMFAYQIKKKQKRICMQGSVQAIQNYLVSTAQHAV